MKVVNNRFQSETESAADASSRMLYQVYDIISRSKAVDHQIEQQSLRAPQRRQQSQISGHADAVPTLREAVVTALMCMHKSVQSLAKKVAKATGREHFISPRCVVGVCRLYLTGNLMKMCIHFLPCAKCPFACDPAETIWML